MRYVVLVIVGVACRSNGTSNEIKTVGSGQAPVVAAAPSIARPDALAFTGDLATICPNTRLLIERLIACGGDEAMMRGALKDLPRYDPTAPLPERERSVQMCADLAKAWDDQIVGVPACSFTMEERAVNDAFLAAYYGRRTIPRATGDATVDKNLADFAVARDVLCACTDEECVRRTDKIVTASVKPVPRELPTAMADFEGISDEVSRCTSRIQQAVARTR